MSSHDRASYITYANEQRHPGDFSKATSTFFHPECVINVVHPFNAIDGAEAFQRDFVEPLQNSFEGLYRRDDIVMAGDFDGQSWVSATGYYSGHFCRDWIGIRASNELCFLRYGEFHRMEDGQACETYIFLDIPELMVACGQWPIDIGPALSRGYTGMIPGPATKDGIIKDAPDPDESALSYRIVTDMLSKLATKDEAWRPYWHENMIWYGPGAFGSFIGIEQFASFQVPFESQFEGWSGGTANNGMTKHFTRYGEGNYTCSGGWPSLTGVNVKPFLGQGPTNERVYMRVSDWWRREGDLLVENWVFVDVPHVLLQMGYDVFSMIKR